ncbi:Trp biosynthesis-associated membrane protein [Microbacterium pygmaeum]|uniref:Tryptophan-associated transmembrane protein (Trp_oprn_chp) n=1 Tax=Microbacterium pygmaeum TaxID=370764 RepID=A0A1G8B5X2_9MICO|nr:Trp biosynthesis-associated membrane protein [Microbacterium pygmaeum]SDH28652.1 Tryptophan-associated transmembrane protein (Trp_oprn_chp) [Microbacterium pygmaeum]
MRARARLLAVLAILVAGALGVISSTQTWLDVVLDDGADHLLLVAGADAVPILAPLSLAVLALGAALSIVGPILRFAFGVLTVLVGALLGYLTAVVAFTAPVAAVASRVTTATGITGADAVADLVLSITTTPWPFITLLACVLLVAAGIFTLATAATWRGSGRKYESDTPDGARATSAGRTQTDAAASGSRRFDAVDSWDDLSRGADPTADPSAGPR